MGERNGVIYPPSGVHSVASPPKVALLPWHNTRPSALHPQEVIMEEKSEPKPTAGPDDPGTVRNKEQTREQQDSENRKAHNPSGTSKPRNPKQRNSQS